MLVGILTETNGYSMVTDGAADGVERGAIFKLPSERRDFSFAKF